MTKLILRGAACVVALWLGQAFAADAARKAAGPSFKFAETEYLHRFTQADQHEFTPSGQEDLEKWTDMVTLHFYPSVKDGDGLASAASAILDNYKAHKGIVAHINSVPRTPEKPAEHVMVVLLPQPEFIEAVFARFRITEGIGSAIIYSHRIYGKQAGNEMSAWLQKNGPVLEPKLMELTGLPTAATLKR